MIKPYFLLFIYFILIPQNSIALTSPFPNSAYSAEQMYNFLFRGWKFRLLQVYSASEQVSSGQDSLVFANDTVFCGFEELRIQFANANSTSELDEYQIDLFCNEKPSYQLLVHIPYRQTHKWTLQQFMSGQWPSLQQEDYFFISSQGERTSNFEYKFNRSHDEEQMTFVFYSFRSGRPIYSIDLNEYRIDNEVTRHYSTSITQRDLSILKSHFSVTSTAHANGLYSYVFIVDGSLASENQFSVQSNEHTKDFLTQF